MTSEVEFFFFFFFFFFLFVFFNDMELHCIYEMEPQNFYIYIKHVSLLVLFSLIVRVKENNISILFAYDFLNYN